MAPVTGRLGFLGSHARRLGRVAGSHARRLGPLTYGVTQGVLLLWWLAFYPATMSYDTVMYLWQASTGNWNTQHSVLYTSLVWLSLQTTGGLALLALAQTAAMAAGISYAVTGLRRLGVPGRWLGVAAAAVVCLPAAGTFTVYISKDVPFVICQVFLLGIVARLVAARGRDTRQMWSLAATLCLIALFRQNGFVVIALLTAGLAAFLAGLRARVVLAGLAAVAVGALANLVVYPALGVLPIRSELALGPVYADLAVAYAQRPRAFTAGERDLLARVAPLEFWSGSANCYSADTTVSYAHPEFSFDAARANQSQLVALWLGLVQRMPDVITQARLCRGSIAWNPFPAPAAGWTVKIPISGAGTAFGFPEKRLAESPFRDAIRAGSPVPELHAAGVWLRRFSDTRSFEWLVWRGATWAYVAYLAVFLFARRTRRVSVFALAVVVAANQLNVLANNPAQLVRYMMAPMVLGVLLAPLAFARPTSTRAGPELRTAASRRTGGLRHRPARAR